MFAPKIRKHKRDLPLTFKRNVKTRQESQDNAPGFQFINDNMLQSLDPEIISLCDELESLGGGILTRIEPVKTQIVMASGLSITDNL